MTMKYYESCPFCQQQPNIWNANLNEDLLNATCGDPDCIGSQIRTSLEDWNTRAENPEIERLKNFILREIRGCDLPSHLDEMKELTGQRTRGIINSYCKNGVGGTFEGRENKRMISTRYPDKLFDKINQYAKDGKISFAASVRELCGIALEGKIK